jgi:hypothetical protein
MSNKSHAFFFKDALRRLEFYGDPALSAEIAAHFETIKVALAERKEERAKKKKKKKGESAGVGEAKEAVVATMDVNELAETLATAPKADRVQMLAGAPREELLRMCDTLNIKNKKTI